MPLFLTTKGAPRKQSGVSLIEILVSIAVGLFILAGVVQLYATTTQNSSMVSGSSVIQENARLLFSRVETDVSRAGYAGCMNFNADARRVQNIINQATDPQFLATQFVLGEDNVSVNGKAFDKFIVRYAGSDGRTPVKETSSDSFTVATTESSKFSQGDVVVVGDCSSFGVFKVSNAPANSGVIEFADGTYNTGSFQVDFPDETDMLPSVTYLYRGTGAFEYYVATSAAGTAASASCSAATPQYCALFRKSSAASTADELVEGVDSFEVKYGWRDLSTGNLHLADAGSIANWSGVDRIKVTATLSSLNKTPTNEGQDYISRTYSRTFVFFNQIPGA